jgi:glyoxylase-like metal-dependent hydrolase (beta-lactamase superfamily II)
LTIMDTGFPYSEKRILAYIAGMDRSARDIKRILITHADLDHYGCLAALQKESGARTYASQLEAEAMAEGRSSRPIDRTGNNSLERILIAVFSRLMKATPFRVEEILAEGQTLPVLGGLQVLETPGHSPDHIAYFAPSAHVLFCGDSMRSDEKGLRASRSRNNWDQARAIAAVRKQARVGAQIVCPGHGPVVKDAVGKFPV